MTVNSSLALVQGQNAVVIKPVKDNDTDRHILKTTPDIFTSRKSWKGCSWNTALVFWISIVQ